MLTVRVRSFAIASFLAVAALTLLQPVSAQAAGRGASRYGKLDRDLQAAADSGGSGVRRVIIQTRSDADRAALKRILQAHGDVVDDAENIVWGTMRDGGDGENIVWGTTLHLLGRGSF